MTVGAQTLRRYGQPIMATDNPPDFNHRFVSATGSEKEPVLLLLHGTGGNEDDLLPLGQRLSPRAAMLSPRGRVLENGMPRFFQRTAPGVFDELDLLQRTDELAHFVTAACNRYALDPARMVAVGYSNGANIASSLLLRHPGLIRAAVLFRPMVPFQPESDPDLTGTDALLLAGLEDPMVPCTEPGRLADILRAAGARVKLIWQHSGHELGDQDVEDTRRWLVKWLDGLS